MVYYENKQFYSEQNESGTRKAFTKKFVRKILHEVFINNKKLEEDEYGNPITVDLTPIEEKTILKQIQKLQLYLQQTDYIANIFSELMASYIVSGNKSRLQANIIKYSDILEKREQWRTEINFLSRKILEI